MYILAKICLNAFTKLHSFAYKIIASMHGFKLELDVEA